MLSTIQRFRCAAFPIQRFPAFEVSIQPSLQSLSRRSFSAEPNEEKKVTFEEVLALTAGGQKFAASASIVDPGIEKNVRTVIDLYATEGRRPIPTFQTLHSPTQSFLSRSLAMAFLAEDSGADRDLVLAAFLCHSGHLVTGWDADCPHLSAAVPQYTDKWLKKAGIALHVRAAISLSHTARKYMNSKSANASTKIDTSENHAAERAFRIGAEDRNLKQGSGLGATLSPEECEAFESNMFRDDALNLVAWSDEAALQNQKVMVDEEVLLKFYEAEIRSHLFMNINGQPQDDQMKLVG